MCNQMRLHAPVGELHQVQARCARGQGKICDADKVSVGDVVVMSLERFERPAQQPRGDWPADALLLSESRRGDRGSGNQAGQGESEKGTTGNVHEG